MGEENKPMMAGDVVERISDGEKLQVKMCHRHELVCVAKNDMLVIINAYDVQPSYGEEYDKLHAIITNALQRPVHDDGILSRALTRDLFIKGVRVAPALAVKTQELPTEEKPKIFPGSTLKVSPLSDLELVILVLRFANELAAFQGFTPGTPWSEELSEQEAARAAMDWMRSRNSRRTAVWQTAIRLVDMARQSEAEDAINGIVDAYDPDKLDGPL